jgi:hypothetical protein
MPLKRQHYIKEKNMNQVTHIKNLGKSVMYFTGKTVSESIANAEAWAKKRGVVLSNYYLQVSNGRSIIVGIEKPRKEHDEIPNNRRTT